MYASTEQEHDHEREIANQVKQAKSIHLRPEKKQTFEIKTKKPVKTTTNVLYVVEKSDIQLIRKHLGRPSWSNTKIGKYTFERYLKSEELK